MTLAVKLLTKDYRRTTLGLAERHVVRALVEAMFSADGEVTPERLYLVVDDFDTYVSAASKTLRFGLRLMLAAIRWSPVLYLRFCLLEDLTVDARVQHLERLEKSRFVLMIVAYKTVLTMLFYEDEAELRSIGYPGSDRKQWKRKGLLQAFPQNEESS